MEDVPIADEHPDAELIAACGDFEKIEDQINREYPTSDLDTESPIYHSSLYAVSRVCSAPAGTLEGCKARARILARYSPYLLWEKDGAGGQDRLTGALIRDLLAI
jgi:hypothetical protein